MVDHQKSSSKLSSLGGKMFSVPIGLTWEHDILVLKPSPCLHNGYEVDDWMGLDEGNSWFKSQVRDSYRSQDIVNLNKFEKFKTIKNYGRNSPMSTHTHEIIIIGRAEREGLNDPRPNGL
ncbi:uncharacterized protein TNCV_4430971 [Trichonephila clavipes]|nr:uncharacterized protein TNCV_4430971 [Trichonephila clavipes]